MRIFICILSLIFLSACSSQSDLDEANIKLSEANKRIEELNAQIEKNNKSEVGTTSTATKNDVASKTTVKIEPTEVISSTEWLYSKSEDKMSGGTVSTAFVISKNSVEFSSPYSGPQNALLNLRTDPKYGKDLIFKIERGQILCSSYEGCKVLVRFDEEKPISFSAVGTADNSTETIFITNYSKFVKKMLQAKLVRISTNIYQEGSPVFEFNVNGFDQKQYTIK